MAIAGINKQTGTTRTMDFPFRVWLLEPRQPPCSNKAIAQASVAGLGLSKAWRQCRYLEEQECQQKYFMHVRFHLSRCSGELARHNFVIVLPTPEGVSGTARPAPRRQRAHC